MKLSESFKKYLKDIEGYRSNKIENPNLSYQEYQEYSFKTPKGIMTLDEARMLEVERVFSRVSDLRKIYLNIELKNYQEVVENYLLNEDFLNQDITIKDIKNMSNDLLKDLTDYPFNLVFTKAFQEVWDKQEQKFIVKNVRGEFRTTNLVKGNISFRPAIEIEKNLKKILAVTQKTLNDSKTSNEEKIQSLALFHLNYELLHPFGEGNGRTGRMLLIMLSLRANILPPAFGVEKVEGLTKVKIKPYYEEIEKVLLPKQNKKNWNLLSKIPKNFRDFYLVSLDLTLIEGQKWWFKNKDKDLIKFYFSDYNSNQEKQFLDFAKWIKNNVKAIATEQKTQERKYESLDLDFTDKDNER